MAADGNTNVGSCIHDPNFAIICSFFEKFSSSCGIKGLTFVELQRMVDSRTEISPELIDLHIRLMRKAKKNVNPDRWQRTLAKFCYFQLPEDCWELEQKGYENLNYTQRLRILMTLIGAQFDYNVKFKTDVNKLDVNELRLNPFGKDKDGNNYWVHTDEELNLKVYKEDLDEEKWELVVTDRESLENLINDLMKDRDPNRKLEEIEDDEESDSSGEEDLEEEEQNENLDEEDENLESNEEEDESDDDETVTNKHMLNKSHNKSVETTAKKSNHLLAEAKKILAQNRPLFTYSRKPNPSKSPLTNVGASVKPSLPLDVINLPNGKVTITKSSPLSPNPRRKFVGSTSSNPMALDKEQFAQHLLHLQSEDMLLPLLNDVGAPDTVDELKTIISAKLNKNVDVEKAKDFIARTADILKPKVLHSCDNIDDKTTESKKVKLDEEEEIEEPLMVITGTGNGRDCDTGNENDGEKTEPAPSSTTLLSHKMDDILKNNEQIEHNDDLIPTSSVDVEKKKPKLWTIDAICSSDTKEAKLLRPNDDVSFFPNYSFNRDGKKENSLFRNSGVKEYSSVFGFSNESNESTVTSVPTNFYFGSNNQNPCFLPATIVPESRVNNFTSSAKSHNVKDIVDNLDGDEKMKSSTNFRVENLCTSAQGAFDLCIRKDEEKNICKAEKIENVEQTVTTNKSMEEIEILPRDVGAEQNDSRISKEKAMVEKNEEQCSKSNVDLEIKLQSVNDGRIEFEPDNDVAVDLRSGNDTDNVFKPETKSNVRVESDYENELDDDLANDLSETRKSENDLQGNLQPKDDVTKELEFDDGERTDRQVEKQADFEPQSKNRMEKPINDEIIATESQQPKLHTAKDLILNSESEIIIENKPESTDNVDHIGFQNERESVSHSITAVKLEQTPPNKLETKPAETPALVETKSHIPDVSTNIIENNEDDVVSLANNEAVNKDETATETTNFIKDDSKLNFESKVESLDSPQDLSDKVTIESAIESSKTLETTAEERVSKLPLCTSTLLPTSTVTEIEKLEKQSSHEVTSRLVELSNETDVENKTLECQITIAEQKIAENVPSSAPQVFVEMLDDKLDVNVSKQRDEKMDNETSSKTADNKVQVDEISNVKFAQPKLEEAKPAIEPTEQLKQDESVEEDKKKSSKSSPSVLERRSTRSLRSSQTQSTPAEPKPSVVKTSSSKKSTNQEKTDVEVDAKLLQTEETKESTQKEDTEGSAQKEETKENTQKDETEESAQKEETKGSAQKEDIKKTMTPKKARGGWPKGKPRGKAAVKVKIKKEQTSEEDKTKGEGEDDEKEMNETSQERPSKLGAKPKTEGSEEEKGEKHTLTETAENKEMDAEKKKETKSKEAAKKKTLKRGWMNEVDVSNIETTNSGTPGIRQSRRIAQLKIREQAEIKYTEPTSTPKKTNTNQKAKPNLSAKKNVKTPTKKWSKSYKPPKEDSDDGSLSEKSTSKKKKKKKETKKFDVKNAWKASDSSSEEDEEEEHFEEEEEELVVNEASDHEFSPESDIDEDDEYTPIKRARTAHSKPSDEDTSALDNLNCQSCKTADQPEWILLCDTCDEGWHAACLKPPLMSIPEGDWFCPPCQHNKLISNLQRFMKTYDRNVKKRTNEQLRKKRLEYVGINRSNMINESKTIMTSLLKKNMVKVESSSSGEYTDEESEEEPLYQLRVRRQANVSHRLNEYDEIMNSAIQREDGAPLVEEAIETPDVVPSEISNDQQMTIDAEETEKNTNENEEAIIQELADDENGKEENEGSKDEEEEANETEEKVTPVVLQLRNIRKKPARLTELDVSSEEDRYSDEDFKESSDEPDDDDEYGKSDSDSDAVPVRRSTRARRKRYDEDFSNDDSDDEKSDEQEQKRKKKKRSMYSESDSEDEDSTWGKRKKNKQNTSKSWRSSPKKRKRIVFAEDSDDDRKKTKKSRVRYGLEEDSGDDYPQRRTRGRKINYADNLQSESEEETASAQRRKGLKMISDEDDEYVNDEEEEENDENSGKEEEEAIKNNEDEKSESDAKSTPEKLKSVKSTTNQVTPLKTNGPTDPLPPNVNVGVSAETSSSNLQNTTSIPKSETPAPSIPVPVPLPSHKVEPANVSLESMQSMTQNLTAAVTQAPTAPTNYVPLPPIQIPPPQEVKFSPSVMIRPPVPVNYADISPYSDPQRQRLSQIQPIEDEKFVGTPPKLYPIPEHRQPQPPLSSMQLQQQPQQRVLNRPLSPYSIVQRMPPASIMGPAPGGQMMIPRGMANVMPPMRGPPPTLMRAQPPPPIQGPPPPTLECPLPTPTQGQPPPIRIIGPPVTAVNVTAPAVGTPPAGENKRGKRGRGKKTLEKERLEREALEASRAIPGGDETTPGHMLKVSSIDVNAIGPRLPSISYAVSSTSPQQPFPLYSNGQRMPFSQQPPLQTAAVTVTVGSNANAKRVKITPTRMRMPPQRSSTTGPSFPHDPSIPPVTASGDVKSGSVPTSVAHGTVPVPKSEAPSSKMDTSPEQYPHPTSSFAPNQIPRGYNQRPEFTYVRNPMPSMYRGSPPVPVSVVPPKISFNRPPYSNTPGPAPNLNSTSAPSKPSETPQVTHSQPYPTMYPPSTIAAPPSTTANQPTSAYQSLHFKQLPTTGTSQSSPPGIPYTQPPYYSVPSPYPPQLPPVSSFRGAGPPSTISYKPPAASPNVRSAEYAPPPPRPTSQSVGFQYSETSGETDESFNQPSSLTGENERTGEMNGENTEQNTEETTTGEFGGLVSYFSSQRENDLDS